MNWRKHELAQASTGASMNWRKHELMQA